LISIRFKIGAAMVAAVAALSLPLGAARAAPLDAELQSRLVALYDGWNAAVTADKWSDAVALRSAAQRKVLREAMADKKEFADDATMLKFMVPDKVEVLHTAIAKDGTHATLIVRIAKTIPADLKLPEGGPKPGSVQQSEVTLSFAREGKDWKFDEMTFGIDPAEIKACRDETTETLASYNADTAENSGGQIRRVEFKPDHTLIVYRVLDEEDCAILPPREKLAAGGVDLSAMVPYAVIEFDGHPHKSDKQRIWADSFKIQPEE
jgi:hypothetical protein